MRRPHLDAPTQFALVVIAASGLAGAGLAAMWDLLRNRPKQCASS